MSEIEARLRAEAAKQRTERGDMLYYGQPDPWLIEAADLIAAQREALEIGETFLNKCFSAWSCGEPEHRVKTMLDHADKFRAALNACAHLSEKTDG